MGKMTCGKFDDYLNGVIERQDFRIHAEECESCRLAFRLDSQIMNRAGRLNEDLSVPDLWPQIRRHLENTRRRQLNVNWLMAAAAVFLIVAGVLVINYLQQRGEPDTRILSDSAVEKVKQAEAEYIDAINELESIAYTRLENTNAPLAQLYRNKLSLIDDQIRNCQKAIERNPADSLIRRYLLAALHDKQITLKNILELKHEMRKSS
jgi:hypothetical protein